MYSQPSNCSPHTLALDHHLASTDFLQRVCLVEIGEGHNKRLWPALRYKSHSELITSDDDLEGHALLQLSLDPGVGRQGGIIAGHTKLKRIMGKVFLHGRHEETQVAYLFGRSKMKRSLVSLNDESTVETFPLHTLGCKAEYKDDIEWKRAYEAARKRANEAGRIAASPINLRS